VEAPSHVDCRKATLPLADIGTNVCFQPSKCQVWLVLRWNPWLCFIVDERIQIWHGDANLLRESLEETLTEILSGGRILRVREPRTFHDGYVYYFEVTAYDKVVDFCLSAEVLEDLQDTPGYKEQANSFARAIEKRLRNPNPNAFMTRSGVPVEIESFWPREAWSGRVASVVRTNVRDLRDSKLAKCFVLVTHQQQIFELKENPFIEFGGIINSVRNAVDAGNLAFYTDADHPDTPQWVDLRLDLRQRQEPKALEAFLGEKNLLARI
jgi:hypothetical protein